MSNILQHNIERFGMVTVMDVVLYDINNEGKQGAPKLFLDTLKMTNISTEGNNKEIRGGIGNDMLISYDFGRTANIEIQDALLSPASLAVLFGTTTKAVTEISHNVLVKTTADLPNPGTIKNDSLYVYPLDGTTNPIVEGGDQADFPTSVTTPGVRILWIEVVSAGTTKTTTFTSSVSGNADKIVQLPQNTVSITSVLGAASPTNIAIPFVYDASVQKIYIDAAALDTYGAGVVTITFAVTEIIRKEVTLTNDNFPIAMKLVGTSFVIEEKTGKKKKIQIEIPKFKINSNFSFTMDAEGDASVFDFNGVALVQDGELMKIQFLGDYDYDVNA
jgi:hypothetical protein